jgi:hypothetical protein
MPPIPMELGGRFTYDDAALSELGPAVAAAGIPLAEIQQWVEAGHGRMTMKMRMDPETVDRLLTERFADRVDDVLADAKHALGRLSLKTRESVERFLDETGLSDSPAFIEWLAGDRARLRKATE